MATRNLNRPVFDSLTFGIEIETYGSRGVRERVARRIARALGGHAVYTGTHYGTWTAVDSQGRKWNCMSDGSVTGGYGTESCEVVSPVLRWEDVDTLQTVVRELRRAGCRINNTCGIHIHVGAQRFTVKAITNLLKLVFKQENIMYRALGIEHRTRWAAKIGDNNYQAGIMDKVNGGKVKSLDDLNKAFYGCGCVRTRVSHYDPARYTGVNLHNLWYKSGNARTVEFRHFAPSIDGRDKVHAGQVKAYVAFVLALSTKAITSARANGKERRELNADTMAYDWRVFLVCTLGLKGDEFKNARSWLMHRCDGDSGYRNGRAQRAAAQAPTAADTVAGCTPENFAAAQGADEAERAAAAHEDYVQEMWEQRLGYC